MTTARAVRSPGWQELLEQQDLVLSRVQALASGLGEEAWQWRIVTGRWRRVVPGVAVAHSGEVTDRQRAWAAVLHAGRGAVLTADAALVEHGLVVPRPTELHVCIPYERVVRPALLATGEGDEPLSAHRVVKVERSRHPARQPPLLRMPYAVLHAAAWASSPRAGEWRVAAAVQQRRVRPADLRRALGEMPRLPGRGWIAAVLDDVELGAHARTELDLLRLLRRNGLPPPDRLQRPVRAGTRRCYLDAWWERQRVGVEVDGAHHRSVQVWDADVLRANDVAVAHQGARALLLRFSAGNLRHDEVQVVAQLRAALR